MDSRENFLIRSTPADFLVSNKKIFIGYSDIGNIGNRTLWSCFFSFLNSSRYVCSLGNLEILSPNHPEFSIQSNSIKNETLHCIDVVNFSEMNAETGESSPLVTFIIINISVLNDIPLGNSVAHHLITYIETHRMRSEEYLDSNCYYPVITVLVASSFRAKRGFDDSLHLLTMNASDLSIIGKSNEFSEFETSSSLRDSFANLILQFLKVLEYPTILLAYSSRRETLSSKINPRDDLKVSLSFFPFETIKNSTTADKYTYT